MQFEGKTSALNFIRCHDSLAEKDAGGWAEELAADAGRQINLDDKSSVRYKQAAKRAIRMISIQQMCGVQEKRVQNHHIATWEIARCSSIQIKEIAMEKK